MWTFSILTAPTRLEISLVIDSFLGLVWELNSVLLNLGLLRHGWLVCMLELGGETGLCAYRAIA